MFHSGAKGYVNVLSVLDLLMGANVAVAPVNSIYGDVYADVRAVTTAG